MGTKNKYCPKCKQIKLNKEFSPSKQTKDGLDGHCRDCRNIYSRKKYKQNPINRIKFYRKLHPWYTSLDHARQRCNNFKNKKYKWYGAKGIKCFLTIKEIKELWFRDKAYKLKKPSIDRIDNEGHYEFNNCRFIEQSENSRRRA